MRNFYDNFFLHTRRCGEVWTIKRNSWFERREGHVLIALRALVFIVQAVDASFNISKKLAREAPSSDGNVFAVNAVC